MFRLALEPKHVAVNKLIKTVVVCTWFNAYICDYSFIIEKCRLCIYLILCWVVVVHMYLIWYALVSEVHCTFYHDYRVSCGRGWVLEESGAHVFLWKRKENTSNLWQPPDGSCRYEVTNGTHVSVGIAASQFADNVSLGCFLRSFQIHGVYIEWNFYFVVFL
jgi:hypothetical protein